MTMLEELETAEFRALDALRGSLPTSRPMALVRSLAELRLAKRALLKRNPDVLCKAGSGAEARQALSRPSNLIDQAEARKQLIEAIDRKQFEERAPPKRQHDFSRPDDQAYAMAQIKGALAQPLASPWAPRG